MTPAHVTRLQSPIGDLLLAHTTEQLLAVGFAEQDKPALRFLRRHGFEETTLPNTQIFAERLKTAFAAYFKGELTALNTLPVANIGTDFQQRVWHALSRIPAGETQSYSHLALALAQPKAVRAVAAANANNPLLLIRPCHRVIGRNGQLTGYAGGLSRKAWLLAHEQTHR